MSEVVQLNKFRQKKVQQQKQLIRAETSEDVYDAMADVTDEILMAWEEHAVAGTINKYIASELDLPDNDYIEDLNLLAHIANQTQFYHYTIHGPKTNFINARGYVISYKVDGLFELLEDLDDTQDNLLITPEMVTENHARALAVMMHRGYAAVVTSFREKYDV